MKKYILLAIILIIVGLQFFPGLPENKTENPDLSIVISPALPKDVDAILTKACNDCHSYSPNWPWYAHVAPVSFYIGDHVKEGREHFNLSEWGTYSPKRQKHKAKEAIEEIKEGGMPIESYLKLHPEARLTDDEKQTLIDFFNMVRG